MVDHVKVPDDLPMAYRLAMLTPLELRAAVLFADGARYSQVMRYLGATPRSKLSGAVPDRIRRKLGVRRWAELALYRADLKARAGVIT